VITIFTPLLLASRNHCLLFIASGTSTLQGVENVALAINRSPPKGWPKTGFSVAAYRSSKTGMNVMMREWHRLLKEDGVKVWCVSPGFLATGLGSGEEANRMMGGLNPEIGGKFVLAVLEGERDGDVGKVIDRSGVQPW
jgi:NAD(P)-dependent dehydrogenase (short-subunit alcohol dehydrogenase family)